MLELNFPGLAVQAALGLAYLALVICALVSVVKSSFSVPAKLAWVLGVWGIPFVGAVASLIAVKACNHRA